MVCNGSLDDSADTGGACDRRNIALLIGTIEPVSVLHDNPGWINPATDWISALNLNNVGFTVVGLFIATWACAIGYWRLTDAERRWQTGPIRRNHRVTQQG